MPPDGRVPSCVDTTLWYGPVPTRRLKTEGELQLTILNAVAGEYCLGYE